MGVPAIASSRGSNRYIGCLQTNATIFLWTLHQEQVTGMQLSIQDTDTGTLSLQILRSRVPNSGVLQILQVSIFHLAR